MGRTCVGLFGMLSELYIVERFVSFSGFRMNTMDSKYCNEKELLCVLDCLVCCLNCT